MESKKNIWYVQTNPKKYDLIKAILELDYDFWRIQSDNREKTHARDLKEGDLCIFWESGKDAGFVAYGHVIKPVYKQIIPDLFYKYERKKFNNISKDPKEVIQLSYDGCFPEKIKYSTLKQNPDFKDEYLCGLSSFPPGTFFQVTLNSWKFFNNIIGKFVIQTNKIKYWFGGLSAPKDCEEKKFIFEKMMNDGIYALGWSEFTDDMTDLSLNEINSRLKKADLSNSDKNCHRLIKFDMEIGDIIIAKKGDSPSKPLKRIYSIGVITSGYKFNRNLDPRTGNESSHNIHYRDVEWDINFFNDFKENKFPHCFLKLFDVFRKIDTFQMVTLIPPLDFEFYFYLKEAIIKKLGQFVNNNSIDTKKIGLYEKKFRYLKYRARNLKSILTKIKKFDENIKLKNEVDDLYKKLNEFKEQYPFRDNPDSIDRLSADDIIKTTEKGDMKIGDFFHKLEYKLKNIGRYTAWTTTYLKIKNQLDDFKNLLRVVVDENKTLAEKVDANWEKISGMGGGKQIAKKIIFCYFTEFLPIFKIEHLENAHTKIYGKEIHSTNYPKMSIGQQYQFLTQRLLGFKNSLEITKNWNNVFFSTFLYEELGIRNEPLEFSAQNKIISKSGAKILSFLKKQMNIW